MSNVIVGMLPNMNNSIIFSFQKEENTLWNCFSKCSGQCQIFVLSDWMLAKGKKKIFFNLNNEAIFNESMI